MYMDAPTAGRQIELQAFAHFGDLEAVEAAIVRAIVRGEQPVSALKQTTLRIDAGGIERIFGSPAPLFLAVESGDVAEGLLNLKKDATALTDWASFILVATEFFRFGQRQSDACDRLIGAIWDLAFGAPVGAPVVRLAESVRSRLSQR